MRFADEVRAKGQTTEAAVQARIMKHFADHKMTTYSPPIVGVGPHSGDPHYETTPNSNAPIKRGSFVLIDLWAKLDRPRGVYADYTRVAYLGESVPEQYTKVFNVVAAARLLATRLGPADARHFARKGVRLRDLGFARGAGRTVADAGRPRGGLKAGGRAATDGEDEAQQPRGGAARHHHLVPSATARAA